MILPCRISLTDCYPPDSMSLHAIIDHPSSKCSRSWAIILKSSDLSSPTPIVVFTPQYLDIDDKSPGPKSWESDNAYPSQFRLIHEARVLPKANGDLDMVLVAGKEGIVLL